MELLDSLILNLLKVVRVLKEERVLNVGGFLNLNKRYKKNEGLNNIFIPQMFLRWRDICLITARGRSTRKRYLWLSHQQGRDTYGYPVFKVPKVSLFFQSTYGYFVFFSNFTVLDSPFTISIMSEYCEYHWRHTEATNELVNAISRYSIHS